jgi:hypothetical protein
MAMFHETAGVCLQLELAEELTAPERPLRLMAVGAGGGSTPSLHPSETPRAMAPVEFSHYIAPGTGGHGRARADALLAVTQVFGCRVAVFGYDATRRDKFLVMVAARPVLDALDLLLPMIARQMESASRTSAREYAKEVHVAQMQPPKRRATLTVPYFRAFLRGYGAGAAEAIRDQRSAIIAVEGAELTKILAAQEARAEETFDNKFPAARPLRKENTAHDTGFLAGRDAGRAAGFQTEYAAQHDLLFAML